MFDESDYKKAIDAANNRTELIAALSKFGSMTLDATLAARKMPAADFARFKEAIAKERKGEFAGEEAARDFGAILLPVRMMMLSIIANHFNVPFYVAWVRARDVFGPQNMWAELSKRTGIKDVADEDAHGAPRDHG